MAQITSSLSPIQQGPFNPRSMCNDINYTKSQYNPAPNLKHINYSGNMIQPINSELEKSLLNLIFSRMHFPEYHPPSTSCLLISPKTNASDNLTLRYDYHIYKNFIDHKGPNLELNCYRNSFNPSQNETECPRKLRKPSAKNVQSKFKNTYGLIIGKVIKSCKEFWRFYTEQSCQENIDEIEDGRFQYIHNRFKAGDFDPNRFIDFLNDYYKRDPELKKKRGKLVVLEYLMQDPKYGLVLVELVQLFLDPRNADFQNYVSNDTKPKGQILKVLCNQQDLEKLRDKYKEMEIKIQEYEIPCKKQLKDEEPLW